MTSLMTSLVWSHRGITDLSPLLVDLPELEILHLYSNQITDISPLAALTNLKTLFMKDYIVEIANRIFERDEI